MELSASTPVWPGDPQIEFSLAASIDRGDIVNVTRMDLGVHTGTHIDAPRHFIAGGKATDSIPLEVLSGVCSVIDLSYLPPGSCATVKDLESAGIGEGTTRLLIKTSNSARLKNSGPAFFTDFVSIDEDSCRWIVERNIRLVGIDYLSITPFDHPMAGHLELLRAETVILEGLDLSLIREGTYELFCLPLRLSGADGAPARAILVERD